MNAPWIRIATVAALALATGAARAADTNDVALVPPPLNFNPGAAVADAARMFQGIPGLEQAKNGRLWATWYGGGVTEDLHNYIMLVTSADDGATWSSLKLVIDPDGDGVCRAFDPCLWHDPQGRLWLFWAQRGVHGPHTTAHTWAIVTDDATVESPKWSAPRLVHQGIMMNKPTATSAGTWLLPLATWFEEGSCLVVASEDRGASFRTIGRVNVPRREDRNCDEPMIVERKDGSLWLLVRTRYGIGGATSRDGGATWTPAAETGIPHTVSRFFIRRLASGRLLLVRHDGPGPKMGRSHLTAFLSDDDGATWKGGLLLDERPGVSYPDGVQAADGTIRIIYDFNRTTDKQIFMARFTEEDVLKGGLVSSAAKLRIQVNQATGINPKAKKPPAPGPRDPNADGVALTAGSGAGLEIHAGEMDTFVPGARLFMDRAYVVAEVPPALRGMKFVRGSITGVGAVCARPGVVLVATPTAARNRDSLVDDLLKRGFKKVAFPEFAVFNGEANVCTLFQKELAKGGRLEIGKWGVVLVPGKED
jgi:hypothetical protein